MTPAFGRREDGGERSAAEREAARLERERRRALREGREPSEPASSPGPHPESEPEPPPSQAPEPQGPYARDEPPAPPTATNGSAGWSPPPTAPPPADPAPQEPEAAWEEEPEPDEREEPVAAPPDADPGATQPFEPVVTARRTVKLPRPQTDADHHGDGWEEPIGTVRVSRGGGGGASAGYQAQPGAPGYPPYRKLGVSKRRRWWRWILPVIALLIAIAVAVFAYLLYQPFHGPGTGTVNVSVPAGAGAQQIGDLLAARGVVDSGFFFALRARLTGQRGSLRSGPHTLKRDMPYVAALDALTRAPAAAPVTNVTLPEGPSRREYAVAVRRAGLRGDYLRSSRRSSKLSPRDYGAPRGTRTLEGFLFPSTYELRRSDATTGRLVSRQVDAFKENFARVDLDRAKARNLSRYDVLIIASMIEREALVARDRRLISAVIYNRLREGIPLGIDATIRYSLNNWSRPLRQSELDRDSAFNTRRRRGLPPTPIGNPGLKAMRAAANPANVDYLFYVVRPCGNGAHAFSATDAEFQRDVAAYNRARARRGGKDPSRC